MKAVPEDGGNPSHRLNALDPATPARFEEVKTQRTKCGAV